MKKYISQVNSQNFVYPNNTLAEYDVEIIHDINNNSVSGTTSGLTVTASGSNIVVSFNYTWAKNNAEVYIDNSGNLHILSVHMMTNTQSYFKPWICIGSVTTASTGSTTNSGTFSLTVTPAMMGVTTFTTGVYSFEIRMIGSRAIYPVLATATFAAPTPTPTMTSTPTQTPGLPTSTSTPTPTPTPTKAGGTPTPTATQTPTPTKPGSIAYSIKSGTTWTSASQSCATGIVSPNGTVYGSYNSPTVGDKLYTDSAKTTSFTGGNYYFEILKTTRYAVRIDNYGFILDVVAC